MNCKVKLHKTVLKFLQTLALDFPYICLQFFPGNFCRQDEKFLQTTVSKILKSDSSACSCMYALKFEKSTTCLSRPQKFSFKLPIILILKTDFFERRDNAL